MKAQCFLERKAYYWYINTIESYSVLKKFMNYQTTKGHGGKKYILLSERSQSEKDT